jgi:hypothetical protein
MANLTPLVPGIVPLQEGLDLQSPKLVASPGSMQACLNYELIDTLGYSRIAGFTRYDGNTSIKDFPDLRVVTASVQRGVSSHPLTFSNQPIRDSLSNIIGWLFSFVSTSTVTADIKYVSFSGTKVLIGATCNGETMTTDNTSFGESTITQAQMIAFESYLRGLVDPLRDTPVGLHWFRDQLYAIVPMLVIPYEASVDNQVVGYTPYGTLTTTFSAATASILDKVITQPAGVTAPEIGYFIVRDNGGGSWEATSDDTYVLSGDISVGAGSVFHQESPEIADFTPCNIWYAQRPSTYNFSKSYAPPGWFEMLDSFTATVTLSGVTDPFTAVMDNNSAADSTYYFESSSGNSVSAVLLDYFVVSGDFTTGDAVVRLQFSKPVLSAGTHALSITTSDDMYGESSTTTKLGDITVSQAFNYLPGLAELTTHSSRYLFRTANFYAADDMDAFYGVSGASRAFTVRGSYFSFIYTQDDSDLDIPRHVENHCLHLALGYQRGSILLSVVGEPTNFDGSLGASEIACGDRITGLMTLSGTVLGVFADQSIWAITGNTVENFALQVISSRTGCIEYTLANCGEVTYLDCHGVATLQATDAYGDFLGERLSAPVSSWLLPRCKRGSIGTKNTSGVNFAIPVRAKNQYRIFFNDGEILTMTYISGGEKPVGFTFQRYFLESFDITDTARRLVPFAWTSELDRGGIERIYVSHNDFMDLVETAYVFGLEQGNSFDGNYIPHSFETNWYFGEAPIQYSGIQKIRLHGLSRGYTTMDIYAAGIMEDYAFGENVFSTTSENLNLPRTPGNIYNDLLPVTNICNLSNRGLGIQLRFKGQNTDLTKPEPGHTAQVMVVYSRPIGAPDA